MPSALQKQLFALRASGKASNELGLRAQKQSHSKSLLFKPSIAAGQSMDVIFQLCYEGFQDLCALDSRYHVYERSLFHPDSKVQDRNLMTQQENDDLDAVVDTFLGLVGARLLLKPGQKAVEWLVRRFRVHELNTQSLVMTFLPYHNTPLFLTLLAILPKKLSPSLKFLCRYVNSMQNPARESLVQAAEQNPSFFSAINQYTVNTSRAGHQHHLLVSLWANLLVQSVDGILDNSKSGRYATQRLREDDLCTRLLPVLNDALDLKYASELILGCYMVIITLVGKSDLADATIAALMKAVAASWTDDTCAAGLSCIAWLAEQNESVVLPKSVSRAILDLQDLPSLLNATATHQEIQILALGLAEVAIERLVMRNQTRHISLLIGLLENHLLCPSNERKVVELLNSKLKDSELCEMALVERQQISNLKLSLDSSANSLAPRDIEGSDAEVEDVEMLEETTSVGACNLQLDEFKNFEAQLSGLVKVDSLTSFLVNSSTNEYLKALAVFEAALPSKRFLARLFHSSYLASTDQSLALSFLVRIWCTSRSIALKKSALETAADYFSANKPAPDWTAKCVLPFVLVALGDGSRKVRVSASRLMSSIASSISKVKVKQDSTPVGSIYGLKTALIEPVALKDIDMILKTCLVPKLAECVADQDIVKRLLKDIFTSSSNTSHDSKIAGKAPKSAQKISFYSFLCSHASCVQPNEVSAALIERLIVVDRVAGQPRSKFFSSLLRGIKGALSKTTSDKVSSLEEHLRYRNAVLSILHPGDNESLSILLALATDSLITPQQKLQQAAVATFISLWPQIHRASQRQLALSLLSQATLRPTSPHRERAISLLCSIDLCSDIISTFLEEWLGDLQNAQDRPKKQKNDSEKPTSVLAPDDDDTLSKLSLVLGLADSAQLKPSIELFHLLCKVLQHTQRMGTRTGTELSYLTATTLGLMTSLIQSLPNEELLNKLDTSVVRADTLVDCACKTSSLQARSSALLLLSSLARRTPQVVLHSVIPIFTMISFTTARQSDDFSAHVVDQTIQDVIPMLAQKLREQQQDVVSATAEILLSFATAFEHIPPHRRVRLFGLLVSALGPDQALFAVIAVLVDNFPENADVSRFGATLFSFFGSVVSMTTILKYLTLIEEGLSPRLRLFSTICKQGSVAVRKDHAILTHLQMLSTLLQDPKFKADVRSSLKSGSSRHALRTTFIEAFERVVQVSQQSSFLLRPEVDVVLNHLIASFPFEEMSTALELLFDHSDLELGKTVLQTLESRIRSIKQAAKQSTEAIVSLLRHLGEALKMPNKDSLKPNVLTCIDCICEKFGHADPDATSQVMRVISGASCLGSGNQQLRVLSLHCLGSAVEVLGNDFIPLLGQTETAAITSLNDAFAGSKPIESLHNGAFAFLITLEDHVPFMISKKTLRAALVASVRSAMAGLEGIAADNRSQFCNLAATKIGLTMVFQSLHYLWDTILSCGPLALTEILAMIKLAIESQSKIYITRNSKSVFMVIFHMLDIRRNTRSAMYSKTDVDILEQLANDVFVTFVLKINDAVFRPFYFQLVDWTTTLPVAESEGKALRTMALFKVVLALSEKLKSIFTSYAADLVKCASEILSLSSPGPVGSELVESVVHALTSFFKYDQDDFWQAPARFDAIMPPLITQLSSSTVARARTDVIPALLELAATASSTENHRAMNSMLLKLFRSDSARTRLVTVHCQKAFAERFGDEWLGHLPEMLPFINELQEDDDEIVERETNVWIRVIEETLGESLSTMLQ